MKNLVLLFAILFLMHFNGISYSQWNQTLSPVVGAVYSLAANGTNVFAGTDSGVYVTSDKGINWAQSNNGLTNKKIYSFAVSGTKIYAGLIGVFQSTNNGANWTPLGLSNTVGLSLLVTGNNIFVGTGGGVYLSTNKGTSWIQVNNGLNNSLDVRALAISGNNIFAVTNGYGVYLSSNNGTNWTQVNNGQPPSWIYSLTANGIELFAGTHFQGAWKRPLAEFTNVSKDVNDSPRDFTLSQNCPNPFNPSTVISYSLPSASNVKLIVCNTLGQTVEILENSFKQPGNYSVPFYASDLPSGIYFYKLEAAHFSQIKKMMLLK